MRSDTVRYYGIDLTTGCIEENLGNGMDGVSDWEDYYKKQVLEMERRVTIRRVLLCSMVFFHMFYRVNYLVDELQSHTRDDAFGVSECTLQSTEGDTSFLGGYTGEQLYTCISQAKHMKMRWGRTDAIAGRTTESSMVVSGKSSSDGGGPFR